MAYLWRWFCALSNRRTYHASGPNPITPQDLETWVRLTGRGAPSPGEAEAVFLLDDLWLSSCAEETKARLGKPAGAVEDKGDGRRRR